MRDAGHAHAHFLSLDVQGAEEVVLRTTDIRSFSTVLVEAEGTEMEGIGACTICCSLTASGSYLTPPLHAPTGAPATTRYTLSRACEISAPPKRLDESWRAVLQRSSRTCKNKYNFSTCRDAGRAT